MFVVHSLLALLLRLQYALGHRTTMKAIRSGKCKLVVLASNTPPLRYPHALTSHICAPF